MARTVDRAMREFVEQHPRPGNNPVDHLRHIVEVFADSDPDEWVVMASSNAYGPGVRTGLTRGDLAAILALLDGKGLRAT
jgi:hypothetical protein